MRKLLAAAAIAGTLTAAAVTTGVGTAAATPPPPSPQCSIVAYPLVFLIEATGGQNSPLRAGAQAIVDAVCH